MKICAVRDHATDCFMPPFVVQATGQGIRSFLDELAKADSPMGMHPEDYDLFHIGDFDEFTGTLTGFEPVRLVSGGAAAREK